MFKCFLFHLWSSWPPGEAMLEVIYDCPANNIVKPSGQCIQAPNRRNSMNSGERWLRSTPSDLADAVKILQLLWRLIWCPP